MRESGAVATGRVPAGPGYNVRRRNAMRIGVASGPGSWSATNRSITCVGATVNGEPTGAGASQTAAIGSSLCACAPVDGALNAFAHADMP